MLPDVSMLIDFARMVIEIAILTLVIYKILYYMRGARGSYVLAGIIILLVALIVISQYLKLEAINFLLQWLLVSLPTALFIIFQPELRRAFAQLGSYTVFQGKRRREVIGELVTATANMNYDMIPDGSSAGIQVGETMSLGDLLYCAMLASGNDACVAMAEYICGTDDIFVEKMNEKAKELGLENTHFANTNGLPADDHYSSARDIAVMSKELLSHEGILSYLSSESGTTTAV